MADKPETSKNTAENLSCSACAKFVEILSDDGFEVKCDDCGSDDPVVALCINCTLCLCECCKMYHCRKNKSHDVVRFQSTEKVIYCTKHPKNELDYFCQNCQNLICLSCSLKEHVEHTHNTVVISATKHRNELTKMITVDEMSENLTKAEAGIFNMKDKIQKQATRIDEIIDKCLADQVAKLNEHHQELKKQLQDELSQKEEALTTQLKDIKSVQDQLANMKKQREGLKKTSDHKVLPKKKEVIEKSMQEVSDKYKTLNTLPVETDSIEFVPVNNLNLLLGHLFTSAHPHTSEVVDLPHNIGYNSNVDVTIQHEIVRVKSAQREVITYR